MIFLNLAHWICSFHCQFLMMLMLLFLSWSGGLQSYWRNLVETCLLRNQWPPSPHVYPSPGLETKKRIETEKVRPPAAAASRTPQPSPATSRTMNAETRYEDLHQYYPLTKENLYVSSPDNIDYKSESILILRGKNHQFPHQLYKWASLSK